VERCSLIQNIQISVCGVQQVDSQNPQVGLDLARAAEATKFEKILNPKIQRNKTGEERTWYFSA